MKSLIPSHREDKRYLLIRGRNLKIDIPNAIYDFIGNLGMSQVSLNFIKIAKDSAIISINKNMLNKVRASLVVCPKKINIEKVSGTLKGLNK